MRPVKELIDVATKLETLEDLVQNLQDIIADITNVIKKSSAWVDEAENTTYQDIQQMLVSKTCQYIQQLFHIACERNNKLAVSAITDQQMNTISQIETLGSDIKGSPDYKRFEEKLKEITASVQSQSERIDILQERNESLVKEKLKDITASVKTQSDITTILQEKHSILEKATKKLSKQNKDREKMCEENYKEIMAELSVASSFMSNLKEENIKLSMDLAEHNKKIENVSDVVFKEIEKISEFVDLNQHLDNSKEIIERLKEENANYQASLETKESENEKLKEELGFFPKDFLERAERSLTDLRKLNINFLLLGCHGFGKSALGNSLLQRMCFEVNNSEKPKHKAVQCEFGEFNGRGIGVFELPDYHAQSERQQLEALFKITKDKIKYQCSHGFAVILLVLRFRCGVTKDYFSLIENFKTTFGQNALKDYGIFVMTFGDCLKINFEANLFQDWIQRQSYFRKGLIECNGRALLFDNHTQVKEEQTEQLHNLMDMVDKLILDHTFKTTSLKF